MATAPLVISERRIGNCCIVRVSGRLVAEEDSRRFRDTMDSLVKRGFLQFVLNLRDVITLDSGGVGSIVAKYLTVRRAGGDLKLVCLSGRAWHVLDIAGLLRVFEVFDDEERAAASFQGSTARA
jgi:anti-sigma B factor antagonist